MLRNSPKAAFHPGAYLRELLIWKHIDFDEFSELTGIPQTQITEIVASRRGIDRAVSEGLAAYFGNSAQFWLELQYNFDRWVQGEGATR